MECPGRKILLHLHQCQPSCTPLTEKLFEPHQENYFLLAAQLRDADYLKFLYISWKYTIHVPLHTNLHALSFSFPFLEPFLEGNEMLQKIFQKNIPLFIVVPFLVPCYNFCKFLSHSFCIWDCCILSSSFHPCLMVFLKLFWKLIVNFIILIPILSSSKMNRNCLFLQKAVKFTDCENFAATLLWSFL